MANRPRSAGPVIAVAGIVVLAVVGAALLYRRQTDDGGNTATAPAASASIAPTGAASLLDPTRIVVEASSVLSPTDGITYDPRNTLDGDLLTAWNSDTSEVVGQTLIYRFAEPVDLAALRFVNGYAKSDEIFTANHRMKTLQVTTDQGARELSLLDTDEPQEITFEFGLTSKVELEVTEIFEGGGFNSPDITSDLALTEISFLAVQRR